MSVATATSRTVARDRFLGSGAKKTNPRGYKKKNDVDIFCPSVVNSRTLQVTRLLSEREHRFLVKSNVYKNRIHLQGFVLTEKNC